MERPGTALLSRAVELAATGSSTGDGGPFGCVIAHDGEVLAEAWNRVIADNDPTAHAEVVAIRRACERLGSFQLAGCVVYASCEPCPMCLGAIYWARPARVVFAATREDAAAIGFDDEFLYTELQVAPADRRIPTEHVRDPAAGAVMREWHAAARRVRY